jgi:signal transduction histidine kinase
MFNRLRIRTKLTLVVGVSLLALALVSILGFSTINAVKIGSPIEYEVQKHNDLRADISSPLATIEEPFLLLNLLGTESDPTRIEELTNRLITLHSEYETRVEFWNASLQEEGAGEQAVRDAFVATVPSGRTFWQLTFDNFLPAIQVGDRPAAAAITAGPIRDAWLDHETKLAVLRTSNGAHLADKQQASDDLLATRIPLMIGGVALAAIIMLLVSTAITRSIRRQIERLKAAAIFTAERELPDTVAAIDALDPDEPLPVLEPLPTSSRDELGDLARAFDSVRQTAVGLAGRQAAARRSVAEMFVNLGRRNQALVNRQLSFIDALERNEEDPQVLEDLFRLDHLATRMRRNAESLLVLAGSEQARRWTDPIEVGNVIRGALSEIEEYEQVRIQTLDPALVRGAAVADLSHLLAELLENATSFSPPTSDVVVVGRRVSDGYVISIVDEGIGIAPEALTATNARLEQVTRFDENPSKVLGLYVVGRLASRHGIDVRLVESPARGVTARVHLPIRILESDAPVTAMVPPLLSSPGPLLSEPSASPSESPRRPSAATPMASSSGVGASIDEALARLTASVPSTRELVSPPADTSPNDTAAFAAERGAFSAKTFDPASYERTSQEGAPFEGTSFEAAAFDKTAFEPAPYEPAPFRNASFDPPTFDRASSDAPATAAAEPWPRPSDEVDDLFGITPVDHSMLSPFPGDVDAFDSPFSTQSWPGTVAPAAPAPPSPSRTLSSFPSAPAALPPTAPTTPSDPWAFEPTPSSATPVPSSGARLDPVGGASTTTTPNGLIRRVRGAQLPDTGPAREDAAPEARSADDVRALLNRFRLGVEQGHLRAGAHDPRGAQPRGGNES